MINDKSFDDKQDQASGIKMEKSADPKNFLNIFPGMLCIADENGHFTYLNSEWEKTLGYSVAELSAKPLLDFIHRDDRESTRKEMQKLYAGGETFNFENRCRCKDGSYKTLEWRSALSQDGKLYAVALDISDRKRAETSLSQTHRRIESIIEGTHLGTWEWNVQTGETVFNEMWANILGYTIAELNPVNIQTWERLTHPGDLRHSGELLTRHFSGELPYYDCECRMKHKNGHWIWIHDRGRVMTWTEDGAPLLMFGTHTDVTDRKMAADMALRESEDRLSLAVEAADAGLWALDKATGSMWGTDNLRDLFQFGPDEPLCLNRFLETIHPEDRDLFKEHIGSSLESHQLLQLDYRIRKPDGSIRWVSTRGRCYGADGASSNMMGVVMDITDRKLAEGVLTFKTTLLEAQSETVPDGILVVDENSRIVYFNRYFAELWNIPQHVLNSTDDNALLKHAVTQVKDPEAFITKVNSLYEHRDEKSRDELMMNDGRCFDRRSSPLITAAGGYLGRIWFFRDITDSKKILEELEAHRTNLEKMIAARTQELATASLKLKMNEERFGYALEASNDGIWDWNIRDNISYLNPAYSKMLGYVPGELGLNFHSHLIALLHPDEKESVCETILQHLEKEGTYELEFRMRTKSGGYKWILSRGKIVARDHAGRTVRAVGIHTDLTAHKKLEMELRRVGEELRAIFDSTPVGIVLLKDRQVIRCNRRLEEIFGYGPGELDGISILIGYADEAHCIAIEEEGYPLIWQGETYRKEIQFIKKDRQRFWSRITARAVRSDNREAGILISLEDITVERDAQQALHEAKEIAEQAARVKSDFLANMSHEIRTPMNSIIGFSRLALQANSLHKQQDYIRKIQQSGIHLLGIIDDILDFSKIEAGKFSIEKVPFELETVMENVSNMIAEKAIAKNLELYIHVADGTPNFLIGDPLRLGQILINYANNAIKFTERGEIVISVKVIEETRNTVLLHFSVRDTGIGLSQKDRSVLFQPFQQADTSISRKHGGTGLGLVISKNLAELMGGNVGVESEYGEGSTFWFTASLGKRTENIIKYIPEPDLRGRRLMVVDDNMTSRQVLIQMLSGMTFNVKGVDCGDAAIVEIQVAADAGKPYEIIFIDWKMPGMDGLDTANAIRRLPIESIPHMVIVTAYAQDENFEKILRADLKDVLIKPVSPSTMFDTINEILGGQRLAREEMAPPEISPTRNLSSIEGAAILLVEDNEFNRQIATEILVSSGFEVDIAENGKEALNKIAAQSYDIVLMDMQMPVMDGVTATAEIRKQKAFKRLPIIAMTANVMQADIQMCMKAGMNDHIGKPIDPDELFGKLLKWVKSDRPLMHADARALRLVSEEMPELPEIPGLDTELGLKRTMGRRHFYLDMLSLFIKNQKDIPEQIYRSLEAGDYAEAERFAHTAKSVCGNIGALELQTLSAELEKAIHERKNADVLDTRWLPFAKAHARLIAGLTQALPVMETRPTAPVIDPGDKRNASFVIRKFAGMLADFDGSALDYFYEVKPLMVGVLGYTPVQEIQEVSEKFDFVDALKLIEQYGKEKGVWP